MKILSAFFALLLLTSCATSRQMNSEVPSMSEGQYTSVLEKFSRSAKKYKGLHNTMDVRAVLITEEMKQAQLKYSAYLYQWDKTKWQEEEGNSKERSAKQTDVFVSFFTPEKKIDDLHRSKTLWKIFLDFDGRRVEGKATKLTLPTSELQGLYPDHDRFSTPYMVSFPVPTTLLTGKKAKLTITGSVDSATLDF